jgi:hypothetical protein
VLEPPLADEGFAMPFHLFRRFRVDHFVVVLGDRELVLRLASLLWRLRRIIAIETDLFRIQAEILRDRRNTETTQYGERLDRAPEVLRPAEGDRLSCSAPRYRRGN